MSSLFQLLLHTPWWIAGLMGIAGAALFLSANRRQDTTLQRAGIAIVLIAVILGILGVIFPSDIQKLEKRSRELVCAVDQKDWNKLKSQLDPNTVLGTASVPVAEGDADIVNRTRAAVEMYGVHSISTINMESKQTDTLITVSLDVVSGQDFTQDRPIASSWLLDYQQSGNDWILQKITLIRIGDKTGDQMINPFRR